LFGPSIDLLVGPTQLLKHGGSNETRRNHPNCMW
jgi:hypothetical protein